jgi:uncharacterized protein (TIGR00251 family)
LRLPGRTPARSRLAKVAVEVTPRSREAGVVGRRGDALRVKVVAPPAGGRANKELVGVLAEFFAVRRGAVRVVRGASSRRKVVEIEGLGDAEVAAATASLPADEAGGGK